MKPAKNRNWRVGRPAYLKMAPSMGADPIVDAVVKAAMDEMGRLLDRGCNHDLTSMILRRLEARVLAATQSAFRDA